MSIVKFQINGQQQVLSFVELFKSINDEYINFQFSKFGKLSIFDDTNNYIKISCVHRNILFDINDIMRYQNSYNNIINKEMNRYAGKKDSTAKYKNDRGVRVYNVNSTNMRVLDIRLHARKFRNFYCKKEYVV